MINNQVKTNSIYAVLTALFCALPVSLYADDETPKNDYEGEAHIFTLSDKSAYIKGHWETSQPLRYEGSLEYRYTNEVEQTACLYSIISEIHNDKNTFITPAICTVSHINPTWTSDQYDISVDKHSEHKFQYMVTSVSSEFFNSILSDLEYAVISNGYITDIPDNMFVGCKKLKTVKIGGEVKRIGSNIFGSGEDACTNLTELWLGKSIEDINHLAFQGAKNLKDVYVEWENEADIPDILKEETCAFPHRVVEVVVKDPVSGEEKKENQIFVDATLHVPEGRMSDYENSTWKVFTNKIEYKGNLQFEKTPDNNGAVNSTGGNSSGRVEVPSRVIIEGSEYPVIGIGKNAYKDNQEVTSMILPETITFVDEGAFSGCSEISELTSYNPIPPQITVSAASTRGTSVASQFEGINMETCILFVPEGSAEAYRNSYGWGDFNIILEIEGNSSSTGIVIKPMQQEDDKEEAYYNLSGQRVKTPSKGLYIKKGKKILIK